LNCRKNTKLNFFPWHYIYGRKPQTCGIAIFEWLLAIMILCMGERLFAIGDTHGCYEPLRDLIEHKIQFKKTDKIILL